MNDSKLLLFSAALMLPCGCGDEITEASTPDKTEVDEDAREVALDPDGDGVAEGSLNNSRASMTFELDDPLPELEEAAVSDVDDFRKFDATRDEALGDVADALDIVVSSPRSGITVSLMNDGTLVPSPPTGPGQWSVTMEDNRREFTIEWFNETASGLSLQTGQTYDVLYSLGDNCCVGEVPSTAIEFVVE